MEWLQSQRSEHAIVGRASDGSGPQIGLCLSGGGFRATLFALGAVRYLVEAGHSGKIRAVSSVSGGSVAAAMLADQWPKITASRSADPVGAHVTDRLVDVISTKNLRNRGLGRFAGARLRTGGRYGSARGTTMVRHLLDVERLGNLPHDLQVVLTSTDLTTGRAFRMSQEFIGSWDLDYAPPPPTLGLATALAASTAVPPIFPPVHLKTADLGLKTRHDEMSLLDGGVYDNLGLEWFQGWNRGRPAPARECDFIICLDSSGPLPRNDKRFGWAGSVRRSQAVQYQQSRASRIRWYVDQLLDGKAHGLHVPISYDPGAYNPPPGVDRVPDAASGALPDGFAKVLGSVRTDLDRFSRVESDLLGYHGYWGTHVRMRHIHPEMAVETPAWTTFAKISEADVTSLTRTLKRGADFKFVRR